MALLVNKEFKNRKIQTQPAKTDKTTIIEIPFFLNPFQYDSKQR